MIKNYNYFFFEKIPSILIILLPITLISGPFLSDLSVSIIAILFITYLIKKKDYSFINHKFTKIFLIFWLYILINSFLINNSFGAIKISLFYFRFLFFCLSFSYLLEKNNNLLKNLFFSFLFSFILLIIDGYFQYFSGYNLLGLKLPDGPRVSSFFGDELILGSYLSRLFPIFFGLTIFLYKEEKKKILIISLIFVLIEALVFLSGERVAFFYINISAIFIIFFIKDFKRLRILTLLFSFIIIILITLYDDSAKKRILDVTLDQMGFTKNDSGVTGKYIFSEEHNDQYLTAINMFKDKPLFGLGIKGFRKNCNDQKYIHGNYGCTTHPHNTYLQLLAETGFLGFIILFYVFLMFSIYMFKHFLKTLKKKSLFSDFEICLLSAIFITIWPISPTGNFFNNWLSIIYYFPAGILLWSIRKKFIKSN